ncbi:MAG: hypothetical protein SFW36_21125 [Leptolyngbyaceae cyanobacterium bins.59]|nr:hypothetical protein [Leptolyngbyaceae cyanobacterium bins.59]
MYFPCRLGRHQGSLCFAHFTVFLFPVSMDLTLRGLPVFHTSLQQAS